MRTRGPTWRIVPSSFGRSGPRARAGDVVLDLACGDGGLADFLPEQRYVGVDASEEMVAAGRERGRELVLADLNEYVPPRAGAGDDDLPRDLLRARPSRAARADRGVHREEARLRPQPAPVRARGHRAPTCALPASTSVDTRPFFVPQTRALPFLQVLERSGPLARLLLRYRFTLMIAASRRAGAS